MWSYNARERRPGPPESSQSGTASYDGTERLVSRSKRHQERGPRRGPDSTNSTTTPTTSTPMTATRNREEQGS